MLDGSALHVAKWFRSGLCSGEGTNGRSGKGLCTTLGDPVVDVGRVDCEGALSWSSPEETPAQLS